MNKLLHKLYVVVRDDLSTSQQAVQAGHAVAEYLKCNPNTIWNNGILVYLSVDELKLEKCILKLRKRNIDWVLGSPAQVCWINP